MKLTDSPGWSRARDAGDGPAVCTARHAEATSTELDGVTYHAAVPPVFETENFSVKVLPCCTVVADNVHSASSVEPALMTSAPRHVAETGTARPVSSPVAVPENSTAPDPTVLYVQVNRMEPPPGRV